MNRVPARRGLNTGRRQSITVVILLVCVAALGGENEAVQFRPMELSFTARNDYTNPVVQVQMDGLFTGPDGSILAIPAFWDGGHTWKVRFSPTMAGRWIYVTKSKPKDAGLDGQTGSIFAARAQGNNPLCGHGGFLKVSPDGHYLTYTDGAPFFWLGDTWWFCPSDLMPFESCYRLCIDTRRKQSFTVVHMCFLGDTKTSGGINTFRNFAKTETINPEYWQKADEYLEYANDAGMVPVFGLAFSAGMDVLTLQQWQVIWRYVIARYGAYSVSFLICGEYNQARAGNVDERVPMTMSLGRFIKELDPYKRAMTVHPWWYRGDKRQAWNEAWYDFITLQGAHVKTPPPHSLYYDAYRFGKPVLEGECRYEGIHGFTAADVREVAYRAIQAGSFGYTYGSHGLWYPTQNVDDDTFKNWGKPVVWNKALQRPGGAHMRHLRACYESAAWWKLKPTPDAVKTGVELQESQKILANADGDRTYLIYFPRGKEVSLEAWLADIPSGASYSAEWFDPRTGEMDKVREALVAVDSKLKLPRKIDEQDWMLILRKQ